MDKNQNALELLLTTLSDNIKHYRSLSQMSQQELAEKSGISTTFLTGLEIMRRAPSVETLVKISLALGIEPFQLLVPHNQRDQEMRKGLANEVEQMVKEALNRWVHRS